MSIVYCVAIIAYFIGSLPAGYVAGKLAGIDIRQAGSGNVGATNVTRVLGKRFGYPVFVVDVAKGFAAVKLAERLCDSTHLGASLVDLCGVIAATSAVIGHSYPIWLRFKGGKGVATSIGGLFALNWLAASIMCIVWIIVFQATRYVSLASILAAIALPVTIAGMIFTQQTHSFVLLYFSLLLSAIVLFRHRSNISRLLGGTEPRFVRK